MFEVIFALIITGVLIYLENRVQNRLNAVNIEAERILETLKNTRQGIKKINEFFGRTKKINIKKVKSILALTLDIIEVVLLIKQAGFKKVFIKKLLRKFV